MTTTHRRPGERVVLALRARLVSRTVEPDGPVIAQGDPTSGGVRWTVEAHRTGLRVRTPKTTLDFELAELLDAVRAAGLNTYDDDFGGDLVETSMVSHADGTSSTLPEGRRMWGNTRWTVTVDVTGTPLVDDDLDDIDPLDGCVHLSVHANDRASAVPWRVLQRIKNDIVGVERWACEWFPPESHLMDEANERHLWVWPTHVDPPAPLAYHGPRTVCTPDEVEGHGARQDPLPSWYPEAATS